MAHVSRNDVTDRSSCRPAYPLMITVGLHVENCSPCTTHYSQHPFRSSESSSTQHRTASTGPFLFVATIA